MSLTIDDGHAVESADARMPAPLNLWHDDRPLPAWVQALANDFDVDDLVEVIIGRCLSIAFPNQAHDDDFREYLTASTSANARCLRSVIAGEIALEDVYLETVLSFAKVQAQLRIPQKSMQRSYRISFFTMWEAWSGHLRKAIKDGDVDRDEAALAQQLLTQTILGYQDFVASQVAETYTRDYEALNRSRAHMRRSLVKDILRDENGVLSGSDAAILTYDLASRHIAVLLPTVAEGAAAQLAIGLRNAVSCQHSLVYPLTLSSTVVWLGRIGEWKRSVLDALDGVLTEAGVPATVGGAHAGIDGFRTTLAEALDAERIRAAWDRPWRAVGGAPRRRRAGDPAHARPRTGAPVRRPRTRPAGRRHRRGRAAAGDAGGVVPVRLACGRRRASATARAHRAQPPSQGRGTARPHPQRAAHRASGRGPLDPAAVGCRGGVTSSCGGHAAIIRPSRQVFAAATQ